MKKQQRLDAIIRDLKQQYFSGKELDISPQGGGFSTANNFKLTCDGKHYLLRLFPETVGEYSLNKEMQLTKLAGDNGLGPKLRHENGSLRYLLIDFIDGRTLIKSDLSDESCLQKIVELLLTLRTFKVDKSFKAASPYSELQHFLDELINGDEWKEFFKEDLRLCESIYRKSSESVGLIHGDTNLNNFILDTQGRLWLIDWTNAGYDTIYSDISMLLSFMSDTTSEKFLDIYQTKSGEVLSEDMLKESALLRRFVFVTWALAQAQRLAPTALISTSSLQVSSDEVSVSILLDDIVQKRRPLSTREDALELLSHFYKDYSQHKEQYLRSLHERRNPGP